MKTYNIHHMPFYCHGNEDAKARSKEQIKGEYTTIRATTLFHKNSESEIEKILKGDQIILEDDFPPTDNPICSEYKDFFIRCAINLMTSKGKNVFLNNVHSR